MANTTQGLPTDTPATINLEELSTAIQRSPVKIQPDWLGRAPDHTVQPKRRLWGGVTFPNSAQGVAPNAAHVDPATGRVFSATADGIIPATDEAQGSGAPVGQPFPVGFTATPGAYPSVHGDHVAYTTEQLEQMLEASKERDASASEAQSGADALTAQLLDAQIEEAKDNLKTRQAAAKKAKTDQEKADAERDVDLAQQAVDHLEAQKPKATGTK